MTQFLAIASLLLGQGEDVRVKPPAKPFACAYSHGFCFDAGGRSILGVTQRGELLFWNGESNGESEGPIVTKLEKKPAGDIFNRRPTSLLLAKDGREAILFYSDGSVQVWLTSMGAKVKELMCDRGNLIYARLSADGSLAAVASRGQEGEASAILFWNTRDWTRAGAIEHADPINDFCFSPDGREVIACVGYPSDQKELGFTGILAWNIETKKETGRIEYGSGFPIRIDASSDGRWIATGGGDAVPVAPDARSLSGHLRIFDWEAKKLVCEPYTLASDYVRAVRFSPDAKQLYGGADPGVRAFSGEDWQLLWTAELGAGNPHDIAVSPNGMDLLVPNSDKLQLVDAKDGSVRGSLLEFRFYPEDKEEGEDEDE
jgi:WD40 repeat protein